MGSDFKLESKSITPSERSTILDSLDVPSPCHLDWSSMTGSERKRFCSECSHHVFNIEEMTLSQVKRALKRWPERCCMRITRRADGSIIFANRSWLWRLSLALRLPLAGLSSLLYFCGMTPPIVAAPSDQSSLAYGIPDGFRAITISVRIEEKNQNEYFNPGNVVNVIWKFQDEKTNETLRVTLIRGARTLSVVGLVRVQKNQGLANSRPANEKTVTLAVSPSDAEKVQHARATGVLILEPAASSEVHDKSIPSVAPD